MKTQLLTLSVFAILLLSLASVSAIYYVNEPTAAGAPGYWVCDSVYQNCEFGVITPCACGTINCDRVNTCESVQSGKVSDTGLVGPAGYPFFLTNGYCQSGFQYNSVGGQSNNCAIPVISAPIVSIISPTNITYNNNLILVNVTSNQVISTWKYSLNSGANVSFSNPLWLTVPFGINTLKIYGTNSNGTGSANVTFFVENVPVIPTAPIVTIVSPANTTYSTNALTLNVSSNQAITTWKYSLNGNSNVTFTNPLTINALNGTNSIKVYGTNANGTGSASVIFYVNSSNGNNNQSNSTIPSIDVTNPKNGYTYNTTNLTLNGTSNQIVNWSYKLNNGVNTSFIPGNSYNLSLVNGTNTIIFYVNNSNGTNSQTITFTYNSSSNNNNVCIPNWLAGSWSSCHNGKKTRSYFDSNHCNNNSGKPDDEKKSCSTGNDNGDCLNVSDNNFVSLVGVSGETIALGNSTQALNSDSKTFNPLWIVYWGIVIILLLLIAIILVYIVKFI